RPGGAAGLRRGPEYLCRVDSDEPRARTRRLDALRGCAALMVVAYHANGLLAVPGGLRANVLDDVRFNLDSGVELFFVLSGYLIALPFLRALVSGGELPGIAAYGLRRAARILPAYWLVLTAALAMSTHAPGATPTGLQLVPHVLLLHGLVPGAISRPLPIAWTLSVEMVFYILVP